MRNETSAVCRREQPQGWKPVYIKKRRPGKIQAVSGRRPVSFLNHLSEIYGQFLICLPRGVGLDLAALETCLILYLIRSSAHKMSWAFLFDQGSPSARRKIRVALGCASELSQLLGERQFGHFTVNSYSVFL